MKKILGFGASSMQGAGDSEGGFFKRLSNDSRFPASAFSFHNLGVGGNTLANMLERTSLALGHKPYDLLVMLGCNDLPRKNDREPERRSTPAIYEARVKKLLATLKGGRSLFISSFAVSEEKTGVDPANLSAYMDLALAAARDEGYEIWDLHRETRDGVEKFWAPDGLHFNEAGHQWIHQGLAEWLSEKESS